MSSEHRPRQRPLVNPEHAHAALERILDAYLMHPEDNRREQRLSEAMAAAQKLLGLTRRRPAKV